MSDFINDFLKSFVLVFAVLDPIGSIPIYLQATGNYDDNVKRKIAIRASVIATLILIFFIVVGQVLLEAMHISLDAFQVSGGLVLFLFSLSMIFGHGKENDGVDKPEDYKHVAVFPIAIPSIASPGAIMAVVLLTDNHRFSIAQQFQTTLVVVFTLLITMFLLLIAKNIQEKIGHVGILVITKVMGLVLAAFAIESVLAGIKSYFNI
jgi:multiple antibiotic resistance protein